MRLPPVLATALVRSECETGKPRQDPEGDKDRSRAHIPTSHAGVFRDVRGTRRAPGGYLVMRETGGGVGGE